MKILFISSDFPRPEKGSNIYTDLACSLNEHGHVIKVVVSEEKKNINTTSIYEERGLSVLRVKTGNIYEVGFVEKTFSFLTVSKKLKKAIKKYFYAEKFDLVLTSSPPVTFNKVIEWTMKYYNARSYLMQKDIFPQNGVDIGLYKKSSFIYRYFRNEEKRLYNICSKIGCMSDGNISYLCNHNNYVNPEKFELFPNTVKINDFLVLTDNERQSIKEKYGFSRNDVVAVFGGNFGKPQGLDFLLRILDKYCCNSKVKFVLIGRGTEKKRIFDYVCEKQYGNVHTYDYIPRDDYQKLIVSCDIGLIFLDNRFTIPNYPSKTLSYFEASLPIMASIDVNTDYGSMLEKVDAGFWCVNGDLDNFIHKFNILIDNRDLRVKMGKNGRKYFEKNCNVEKSVKILERVVK